MASDGDDDLMRMAMASTTQPQTPYGRVLTGRVVMHPVDTTSRPTVPRIALPWWKEQRRKLSVMCARLAETRGAE